MHAYTYHTFRYLFFKHLIVLTLLTCLLCHHFISISVSGGSCSLQLSPEPSTRLRPRSWPAMPKASVSSRWMSSDPRSTTLTGYSYYFRFTFWMTDLRQSQQSRAGCGSKLIFSYGPVTVRLMTKMPSLERCLCARCWMLPDLEAAFCSWSYIWPKSVFVG